MRRPARRRTPSSLSKKLLLAFGSLVFTLASGVIGYEWLVQRQYARWRAGFDAEGSLERLTVRSKNETLLWEYKPYGRFEDERHVIETNRWGFRDQDYPKAKPETVERIAFVGDSVTLGFFVEPHETFVAQFGALAAERHPERPIQAMNFGVDGYHALQIIELVRTRVLAFAPDQIVYVLCLNDFDFEDASGDKIVYFKPPRSFLLRDLRRLAHLLTGTEYHRHHYDRTRDEVLNALENLDRWLRRRGVPWIVAIMPAFPKHDPPPPDFFLHYPHASIHAEIVAFLEARDVPVTDLFFPIVQTGLPARELAVDLWHPTARGHRVIAQALSRRLLPATSAGAGPPGRRPHSTETSNK